MQHNNQDPGSPEEWLRHARSDLELCRINRPPEVLFETLCFHAQQAAEKAIKAVLIAKNIPFPKTHNIRTLLDLIPIDVSISEKVENAAGLTDYAVLSRYPGDLENVDEQEYKETVQFAEAVIRWATQILSS